MRTLTPCSYRALVLLVSALCAMSSSAAAMEAELGSSATPDPCLSAVQAGAADADRTCSDVIAGLRYEGATSGTNTALAGALNNRAMARMRSGDLEEAALDLTEALDLAPTAWALYLNRANLSLINGDAAAALEDLGRIRELAPADSAAALAAIRNSVLAWRMLGNLNAAEAQLVATQSQRQPVQPGDGLSPASPAPAAPARPPG